MTLRNCVLAIESETVDLAEMVAVLGSAPDSGFQRGEPSGLRGAVRRRSSWMKELRWEGDVHPGTMGLSSAIEALGDELAQKVRKLVNAGCAATVAVVQELTTDTCSHGLALSAAATAWMGSAKAGLTVDQYVDSM
ncbi:hypothetical protein [Microbacterium sp. NPDC056052]|uniref:hypothetical protein n=1 Tax=Microbacterium sp. NPDC056052 TaxID=3345695 RepID=UPI0035E28501